jgi:hypothetical protein
VNGWLVAEKALKRLNNAANCCGRPFEEGGGAEWCLWLLMESEGSMEAKKWWFQL